MARATHRTGSRHDEDLCDLPLELAAILFAPAAQQFEDAGNLLQILHREASHQAAVGRVIALHRFDVLFGVIHTRNRADRLRFVNREGRPGSSASQSAPVAIADRGRSLGQRPIGTKRRTPRSADSLE